MRRALFIVLCGPEGTGKSTNIAYIVHLAKVYGLDTHTITSHRLTVGTLATNIGRKIGLVGNRGRFERQSDSDQTTAPYKTGVGVVASKDRIRLWRRGIAYCVDAIVYRMYLRLGPCRRVDVIVADRYVYDSLAKVIGRSVVIHRCIRLAMRQPHMAILLTGRPEELIVRRKGATIEYCNAALSRYAGMARRCPELVQVPIGNLKETQAFIRERVTPLLVRRALAVGRQGDEGRAHVDNNTSL